MILRTILFSFGAILVAGLGSAGTKAEAQSFPSHLKSCKKSPEFERVDAEYMVPVVGGGADVVRVVSQNYTCTDSKTRNQDWHAFQGLKDSRGKLVVPIAYKKVLPFSTTGAVVISHAKDSSVGGLKYRTYIAGKGEGREGFELQEARMLVPNAGCPTNSTAASPRTVAAVMGETWIRGGGGKTDVTLFTPEGNARRLEAVGGDKIKPAVRRVGDVLVVRWLDAGGALRTGILDLNGRAAAPVLSNSQLWLTPKADVRTTSIDGCNAASLDLFIEGPSLDWYAGNPFFGPLLIPVGRDGQPARMPKGAVGMFPAFPRDNTSSYTDAPRNVAATWAVVFLTKEGFEFTLYSGTPSEALIAAETGTRYATMARTRYYGGIVTAQQTGGKWVTFRADSDTVVGEPDVDYDRNRNGAMAILDAEAAQSAQAHAAAVAKDEQQRAEAHKRHWETARAAGRLCDYRVDSGNSREEVEEYLAACGPGHFDGLAELARAKGIPETTIQAASDSEWKRSMAQAKMIAQAEENARIQRMQNANKDPGASYVPGQWESAIRNAGNAVVDDINKSSDNWLQQRRDQYRADWQRSQRAY